MPLFDDLRGGGGRGRTTGLGSPSPPPTGGGYDPNAPVFEYYYDLTNYNPNAGGGSPGFEYNYDISNYNPNAPTEPQLGGLGDTSLASLLEGYDIPDELMDVFAEFDPTGAKFAQQQFQQGQQQARTGFGQQLMGLGQQQRQQQSQSGFAGGGLGNLLSQARGQIGTQFGQQREAAQTGLMSNLYGMGKEYREGIQSQLADLIETGAITPTQPTLSSFMQDFIGF